MLKQEQKKVQKRVEELEKIVKVYEQVESNLKPLKSDPLFEYETQYKRFKLAFEVQFETDKFEMENLLNYSSTISKIDQAGFKLKSIIDKLYDEKLKNSESNVSYILVISGYASKTSDNEYHNYELSYKRAWKLWDHWRNMGVDFENEKYTELIDLQISGNGFGGVGRIEPSYSVANQRFLIQIFPKTGDIIQ